MLRPYRSKLKQKKKPVDVCKFCKREAGAAAVLCTDHHEQMWHEWVPSTSMSLLQSLSWIHCLGHAGVYGNERADLMTPRTPILKGDR